MYFIEVTDHFEDFYVGTYTIGEFRNFKKALAKFFDLIKSGYWDGADSLEQYIHDELKTDKEDDVSEWDWSCGFVLSLNNEDYDQVVCHHTRYDYKITHLPVPGERIEVYSSCLNPREKKILAEYGYDGSDKITLKKDIKDISSLEGLKTYILTGPDGHPVESPIPGKFAGHKRLKIYGRLDCPSALRALSKGQYKKHRVFFADEKTAIEAGYRPCGVCMKEAYKKWKTRLGK